jgi:hypothetical protein
VRYISWVLTWPGTGFYGYGPEPVAAVDGAFAEASQWVNAAGVHLGYLHGVVGVVKMADWQAKELNANQALNFAMAIDANAYVLPDGRIGTTTPHPFRA